MPTYTKEFYEKYIKPWREKNRDQWNEYNMKLIRRHRSTLIDLLGGVCVICKRDSSKTTLIIHERHGKPHNTSFGYLREHLEDYIVLCRPHHSSVHRWKNEGTIEAVIKVLGELIDTR